MVCPVISVVIPVYNSSETLLDLATRIGHHLVKQELDYEIIFVDDCSKDNSWAIISSLKSQNIRGVRLTENAGQWYACLIGMKYAVGRYIVTIDDDLEYSPEDISLLYAQIKESQYKVIFGLASDKYRKQGKSNFWTSIRNRLLNFIWNKGITDSFKIFDRSILYENEVFKLDKHFEAYLSQQLDRKFWGYVAVSYNRRAVGDSNYKLTRKIKLLLLLDSHYNVPYRISFVLCIFLLIALAGGSLIFSIEPAAYILLSGGICFFFFILKNVTSLVKEPSEELTE